MFCQYYTQNGDYMFANFKLKRYKFILHVNIPYITIILYYTNILLYYQYILLFLLLYYYYYYYNYTIAKLND